MTPEEEREIRTRYDSDWQAIESVRNELEGYLRQVCARLSRNTDFRPRFVEARPGPKSFSSILRKLNDRGAGPDKLYEVVTDLVGTRVVVYNLSDAEAFLEELLADEVCPIAPVTEERIEYPTGYRAIHANGYIGQYGCEIQIRTAVQDAWAVTSRADVHHLPSDALIETLSEAQATILRGVDDMLQTIRDLREKSRTDEPGAAEPEPPVPPEPPKPPEPPEKPVAPSPPTEGLDHSRMRRAREALASHDEFVLNAPISEARVAALKAGIESERERSAVRVLFRAIGAYERRYEYEATTRFGNRFRAFKGPLVEGSNWAEYHPADFSQGLERFLLFQLGQQLQGALSDAHPIGSWDGLASFVAEAVEEIEQAHGQADILAIVGEPDRSLQMDLTRNTDWSATLIVRGVDLSNSDLVKETVAGIPVLRIYDDRLSPSIHVVDLTRLRYEQTNPDTMSDDNLIVRAEPISWELAAEDIDANPDLPAQLYHSTHGTDGRFTREEAVVRLLLQVRLHIIEGGFIEVPDDALWRSAALLGPNS